MTANSKNPETNPGLECQTKDWVDKAVSETFNELFRQISSKTELHPSETLNNQVFQPDYFDSKIYEFINSYHAVCKLCEQQFYCFSVANDINSFFQKHINTSYHRQNRALNRPADNTPIFTWEEKFFSGRCNICDMSGLNSYILNTDADALKLMELHICVWSREHRQTNEKLLRKLMLLKKYCGLKIFQKKYLKTLQGREVCLLCRLSFPPSEKKALSHLSSDIHYQNFCTLLRKHFSFEPKDVLNGYNLEMVTRWVIITDPPPVVEYTEYDERKVCLEQSNDNENPYFEDYDNFSFSPKLAQVFFEDKDTDFIHNRQCLLCNVEFKPGHAKTQGHKKKAPNVGRHSFDIPEKYETYERNREKRLYIIETIKKLSRGQMKLNVINSRATINSSLRENFFKRLLEEKLELVKEVYTMGSDGKFFCQVCDVTVLPSYERVHLNMSPHKYYAFEWKYLEANLGNGRLVEPFMKIKHLFACLLCGTMFLPDGFCSHLKRADHIRQFEWYCGLDKSISISSAFAFRKDFSCYCTVCNAKLNQGQSFSSVKKTLQAVRSHFPCQVSNKKAGDAKKQKGAAEEKPQSNQINQSNQNNQDSDDGAVVWCSVEESESCANETVNFKKVQEIVESVLGIFENKIIDSVLDKAVRLNNNSGSSKHTAVKEEINLETDAAQKEASSSDTSSAVASPTVDEKKDVEEKEKEGKTKATAQNTHNKGAQQQKTETVNKEKNIKKDHEILIIDGLPQSKKKLLRKELHSKFSEYGNILYINFENASKKSKGKKMAILAFDQPGVAETVAKGPEIYLNDNKLYLIATTRESSKGAGSLPLLLNENLVYLLEEPQKLMDFVLNMVLQAVRSSQSPLEIKREELVCSTVISAIVGRFPQARCYPFGSRLSGLVLDNSDLDVFLDCGGMYEGFKNTSRSAERKLVNEVERLLRKKKEITDFVVVERARVPIISFLHKPTLMHCDLSFKNGLSVQNTLLIKFMISLDWRVRPLILFLKYWAKLNKLHGPPFFSSYAIAMLVIFYLEQLESPVLPTIESLQQSYVGRRRTIAGWDCSINTTNTVKSENLDPLPHLLVGLFDFYGRFDYDKYMVSPLTGKPLPKEAYSDSGFTDLPLSYKRHVLNIPLPIKSIMNPNSSICIVDPFDVTHILTKSFTSEGLEAFRRFCGSSAKYLRKGITACQV